MAHAMRRLEVPELEAGAPMFAPLIFAVLAIYLFLGWAVIAAIDRRIARRRGGSLWVAVLFWPIAVIIDLVTRGPNRG